MYDPYMQVNLFYGAQSAKYLTTRGKYQSLDITD